MTICERKSRSKKERRDINYSNYYLVWILFQGDPGAAGLNGKRGIPGQSVSLESLCFHKLNKLRLVFIKASFCYSLLQFGCAYNCFIDVLKIYESVPLVFNQKIAYALEELLEGDDLSLTHSLDDFPFNMSLRCLCH